MLKRIELRNFRKHQQFTVFCRERNILVGPNNAGKSSILDALRLFADVQRFAEHRVPRFQSFEELGVCAAYEMANSNFSVTLENIANNFSDDYAEIIITHQNDSSLHIRLNPEKIPCVFVKTELKIEKTKKFFSRVFPEKVIIVPTLSTFEDMEKINDPDYVRSVEYTRLSARNFRNIWRLNGMHKFDEFRSLVSDYWPGIEISPPETTGTYPPQLQMFYSEKGFDREIYWSGFGFQAWLQIMTHFLRGEENSVLVLDEPDVYLHADLQRKIFHITKKRFEQFFIATHSSEIMNEANASDVILIKPGVSRGSRITSEAGYRAAHTLLGSSENADFARLSRAKRIIAFEGNDRSILKRFELLLLGKTGVFGDPDTLTIKVGGYENWRRVDDLNWLIQEVFGVEAKIAAIFDRDYRCDAEIEEFEGKFAGTAVRCHVLRRKEIENYLLEFSPLSEAIGKAAAKKGYTISLDDLAQEMDAIAADQRDDALISTQSFLSKFYTSRKDARDPKTYLKMAKIEFDDDWCNIGFKKRIGGKEYLSNLNKHLVNNYSLNITTGGIISEMSSNQLDFGTARSDT